MPRKIRVVTSFDEEGYGLYGKKMLRTLLKHTDVDEVIAYYGGDPEKKPTFSNKRLTIKDLYEVPGCSAFLQATNTFPIFQGILNGKRDYRLDVFRFSRKMFAQMDAATDFDGLLVWLDADTQFTDRIERCFFEEKVGDSVMAYMGRPNWHLCASFIVWNCAHPSAPFFWQNYADLLMSGKFMLLPEWHDSYLLETLATTPELPTINMAAGLTDDQGPVNIFDIVFKGKAHHYKGNKKHGPQRYAQLIELVRKLQPERVMEIGTWNGKRALEMHQAAPGLIYYGFDLFEGATAQTDEEEKNVKPHHKIEDVAKMLQDKGVKAYLVSGNTNESIAAFRAGEAYKGEKMDLIYIDGGHAVETIRSDFKHAKEMIKPGGLIVFDDFYTDMSDEELEKWGANKVLESEEFELMPIIDPVQGGGGTQLALVRC